MAYRDLADFINLGEDTYEGSTYVPPSTPTRPTGPLVIVQRPVPISQVPEASRPLIVAYDVAEVLNAPCPWSAATKARYEELSKSPYVSARQKEQLRAWANQCLGQSKPVVTPVPSTQTPTMTWKPPTIPTFEPSTYVKKPVTKPLVKPQAPTVLFPPTPTKESGPTVTGPVAPSPRPIVDLDSSSYIEELEQQRVALQEKQKKDLEFLRAQQKQAEEAYRKKYVEEQSREIEQQVRQKQVKSQRKEVFPPKVSYEKRVEYSELAAEIMKAGESREKREFAAKSLEERQATAEAITLPYDVRGNVISDIGGVTYALKTALKPTLTAALDIILGMHFDKFIKRLKSKTGVDLNLDIRSIPGVDFQTYGSLPSKAMYSGADPKKELVEAKRVANGLRILALSPDYLKSLSVSDEVLSWMQKYLCKNVDVNVKEVDDIMRKLKPIIDKSFNEVIQTLFNKYSSTVLGTAANEVTSSEKSEAEQLTNARNLMIPLLKELTKDLKLMPIEITNRVEGLITKSESGAFSLSSEKYLLSRERARIVAEMSKQIVNYQQALKSGDEFSAREYKREHDSLLKKLNVIEQKIKKPAPVSLDEKKAVDQVSGLLTKIFRGELAKRYDPAVSEGFAKVYPLDTGSEGAVWTGAEW
jgi:hypothetical protein